jgi:hypothetical protein
MDEDEKIFPPVRPNDPSDKRNLMFRRAKVTKKRIWLKGRERPPRPDDFDEIEMWLDFAHGAYKVEQRLGYTVGHADMTLRSLCASGEVRSVRMKPVETTPLSSGGVLQRWETLLIRPSEWRTTEVDFETDFKNVRIKVSEGDLDHWLAQQNAVQKPAVRSKEKPALGKVPRIVAHLQKMFPDGVPDPAHCPRKGLQSKLLKADPLLAA